jgi:hypothetical protein
MKPGSSTNQHTMQDGWMDGLYVGTLFHCSGAKHDG